MRRVVPPILAVALAILGAFAAIAGEDLQAAVDREISRVGAPPGATLKSAGSYHRPGNALATQQFAGALKFSEVRSFYEVVLSGMGWRFISESSLRDSGRDLGEKQLTYCKGEYIASVQYAGSRTHIGWDFALSITSAKGSECKA
jgi:hypothetical protein